MTEKVKSIIFSGAGQPLEEKEFDLPEKISDDEIIVELTLSTVCGSDVHTWLGHRSFPTPCILGHEMVGKIIKLGKNITNDYDGNPISINDRIVWSMTVSCGICYYCKVAKLPQKCTSLLKYGHVNSNTPPHITGGYANFIQLKKNTYFLKVPDILDDDEVAPLMCAGATVTSGLDSARFSDCDYVVVQGCGALGLCACAFAKELGAKYIIALDLVDERLSLAKEFGADYIFNINTEKNLHQKILDITSNRGVDYVIEVTGDSKSIETGIKYLRIGGSYILLGAIYPGNTITLDSSEIITKCLQIFGRHNYDGIYLKQALDLVLKSKSNYPFKKLVGPIFDFSAEGVENAFKSLDSKTSIRPGINPSKSKYR